MFNKAEGSTGKLVQLCIAYFVLYVITGVTVRYFQYYPNGPLMTPIEYLTYSTTGGVILALGVVLILRWYRFHSARLISLKGIKFPSEFCYILPSGICTAVIITFTTLMYSIKGVSVMVAMVLMRGSVIIIGRVVDHIQIKQGLLKKKVYWEENMGMVFALLAVAIKMFWSVFNHNSSDFDFLSHPVAMTILCSYVAAYAFRIYIMNYFKNTRPKGVKYDTKGYFAIEQISAFVVLLIAAIVLLTVSRAHSSGLQDYHAAVFHPQSGWVWAVLAGTAFGAVAFFSVFIFMFKGRTATFAGLVNRLTSLIAGTAATLISWEFLKGGFPDIQDWLSLAFILVAIGFIAKGERRRSAELVATHEIEETVTK
ncbi:MAG: hypothetical protein KAT71_02755 [Gammaproteobacteria bacterium]|nr:hypothetical protein [Gammaproteobacteria bacterium]